MCTWDSLHSNWNIVCSKLVLPRTFIHSWEATSFPQNSAPILTPSFDAALYDLDSVAGPVLQRPRYVPDIYRMQNARQHNSGN